MLRGQIATSNIDSAGVCSYVASWLAGVGDACFFVSRKGHGHENPQFSSGTDGAASRQQACPPSGPLLHHQQGQQAFQGPPGLKVRSFWYYEDPEPSWATKAMRSMLVAQGGLLFGCWLSLDQRGVRDDLDQGGAVVGDCLGDYGIEVTGGGDLGSLGAHQFGELREVGVVQ